MASIATIISVTAFGIITFSLFQLTDADKVSVGPKGITIEKYPEERHIEKTEIETDYSSFNIKGWELYQLERYGEAIEYFDRALEIEPNYHYSFTNKGVSLYYIGLYEESIQYYDRTLEIEPYDDFALKNKEIVKKKLDLQ